MSAFEDRKGGPGPAVFVGRAEELDRLRLLLEPQRLIVITGLPGVGKRTLAARLAQSLGGGLRRLGAEEALRHGLGEDAAPVLLERLEAVAAQERARLLHEAQGRRRAVLALSQVRVTLEPPVPELRLRGLDEESAARLWSWLDRGRAPVEGFAEAYRRTRGNPRALERAHLGLDPAGDPAPRLLASLDAPTRGLLALCAALPRLPAALAAEVVGAGVLERAQDLLLVQVDGARRCTVVEDVEDLAFAAIVEEERSRLLARLATCAEAVAAELDPMLLALLADRVAPAPPWLRRLRPAALVDTLDLERARDDAEAGDGTRLACALLRGDLERLPGLGDVGVAAAAVLAGERAADEGPPLARVLAALLDERWEDADEAAGGAGPEGRALRAVRLAILGHAEGVPRILAERARAPRAALWWDAATALVAFLGGERLDALARLRATAEAFRASGAELAARYLKIWVGRILLMLGRRRLGWQVLEDTATALERAGLFGVAQSARRSNDWDPIHVIWRARTHTTDRARGPELRGRASKAMRLAAAGNAVAEPLVDELYQECTGKDFAVERMLLGFARALVARERGGARAMEEALAAAARAVAEGEIDASLFDAIARLVRRPRIVTERGRQFIADDRRPAVTGSVVLDGRKHTLRYEGVEVSLARRPIVRRLLYSMAAHPNAPLRKDELVLAVWQRAYNPLQHDNVLKVNVRHLRELLHGSPLVVERVENGYRLLVPDGFVFLEAVEPGESAGP